MRLHHSIRVGVGAAIAVSSLAVLTVAGPLGASTASASTPACSPANLPAHGTVNITYWEGMTSTNETNMQALVKAFNSSQTKVHVTDVNQSGGYVSTWDDYTSSIGTSSEPNVVMLDQYVTQGAVDSKSIVPVATCVAGTKYSTKTFAKKTILEETVGGKLQGLPYSVSAPILIYNQNNMTAAKLKTPPATVALMMADAAKMKGTSYSSGGKKYTDTEGMTLPIDPWYLQVWEGTGNGYFVNAQNGRAGRASAAAFNNSIGQSVFTDLQTMRKRGDCTYNPDTGGINTADANLFDIGSGKSGMTIASSATLGAIFSYLPLFKNVKLGVAAMPRITPTVTGGVQPGGNALFVPSYPNSSAAKLAASWEFVQYLDNAANMAKWDKETGYVPIRSDAASQPIMKAFYSKYPTLKAAYTEIMQGKVDNATAGPLLGDYYAVNNDIVTYENTLLTTSDSPSSLLSAAASKVTSDIQSYNSSL